MNNKLTWCYNAENWIVQDILCLACKRCTLELEQIKKQCELIDKYLGGVEDENKN